jgi:hypothetical protein
MKRVVMLVVALGTVPWASPLPAGARGWSPNAHSGAVSFRRDVAPALVSSCSMVSCHGGGLHPLEIDSDASPSALRLALVGVHSEERPDRRYVTPGDPRASYLVDKLEGRLVDTECVDHDCGERMPARNPPLSDVARGMVRAWIAQGASDD